MQLAECGLYPSLTVIGIGGPRVADWRRGLSPSRCFCNPRLGLSDSRCGAVAGLPADPGDYAVFFSVVLCGWSIFWSTSAIWCSIPAFATERGAIHDGRNLPFTPTSPSNRLAPSAPAFAIPSCDCQLVGTSGRAACFVCSSWATMICSLAGNESTPPAMEFLAAGICLPGTAPQIFNNLSGEVISNHWFSHGYG